MLRLRFLLVIALTLLLTLPLATTQAQPTGTAWIRVINTAPDSTGMNIYLNSALAVRGLAPGNVFNYFQVPAGKQQISFRRGSEVINNAVADLDLADGDYVTIVGLNKLANLQALVLRDDASAVVRGQARVRAFHAVVGGPNVDVITADGTALVSGLAFGAASDYALVNAAEYGVVVSEAGDPGKVVVAVDKVNLRRERRYDIFVIGEAGGRIRAIVAEAATLKATGTNQVRFGHFVAGAGPVDLLLNAEDAFNGVSFGNVTSFALVLAPGSYKAEVFPAGKRDQALVSGDFTVEPDQSVFVMATGAADAPEVHTFSDDYKPVRVGQARLQVVHAATGAPDVSVQAADGSEMLPPTSYGAGGAVDVGAGVVSFRLVAADGTRVLERDVRTDPGKATTVIAYDDPATPGIETATYEYTLSAAVPIRLVHASTKAGAVDVYVDGQKALSGWGFGATTDYIDLAPGVHEVKIYSAGADPATASALIDRTVELGAFPITAVAVDTTNGAAVTLFPDNLAQIGAGRARIRLIQASPEVGTVRWFNQADGTPITSDPIGPGTASSAIDVAAGSYTFTVSSVTDTNIIIRFPSTQLAANSFTTFVIAGPTPNDVIMLTFQGR